MKNYFYLLILLLLPFTVFSQKKTSHNTLSISAGYNDGFGIRSNYTIFNFIKETPMHLRFGLGYSITNPGISNDVRHIFINNNTNGTPEKFGRFIDFRMDFMFPMKIADFLDDSYLNVGPRYSRFKGNFKYIGGNEDFDIVSNQFGLGAGLGNFFEINSKLDFEVNLGLDYYIPNTLTGHDTSYSPDNDNVNPREDYDYKDADKAVFQPKFSPYILLGINYKL